MAPKLPALSKSQSVAQLLPPLVEHSTSKSKKGRDRRPESIPYRKVWGGKFDPIESTRDCLSDVSTRTGSKASSVASCCMSDVSTRTGSRASSVASSRASSRLSSPSSSSRHRTLGQSASVPTLPLHKLAKNQSLPSLTQAPALSQLSDLDAALGKASPSKKDNSEVQQKFEWACRTNDVEQAKICYLRGASLSQALSSGEFPLFYAVRNQHFTFLEFLQQYGVDMNIRDKTGRTALHIAAKNNDDECICRLVQHGAKRQVKDYKGQTALHRAAAAGHRKVVELLLGMGADINATDKAGLTAASHAEFNDHFDLADRLVKLAKPISGMPAKGPRLMFFR